MKVVVDRIVQYPNRFQLVNVSTSEVLGVFDLSAVTGTIQQVGTEIDAELFQSIQDDLTQLARDIVAESNARGVDVNALQNSIATKITANGGELGNAVVTFTEVSNAPNIASGEKASTLFGKIKNWFSRLKALAFKDTIADADISSNANISQSKVSGLTAIQNKLNGIDAGANKYTLPVSTATNLGGVKVGSRLSVGTDGTLSADSQTENSYTTTEKNKLAGIETGAQKNAVTSVAGKTGAVTLDKSNVGLSNVANERQYSASNPPPYPVTSVNGNTGEVNVFVPTKTSELENDSNFLTEDNVPSSVTYTLSKSGSTISLVGSDGSKTSVTDSNTITSVNGQTGAITNVVKDNTTDVVIGSGATNGSSGKSVVVIGAGASIPANNFNNGDVCIGASATCKLGGSIAVGKEASATNYGVALGAKSSAGTEGIALGYKAKAVEDSVAIGTIANSSGDDSVAIMGSSEGVNSIAIKAQAVGIRSVSIGSASYVMGDYSTALGTYSYVEDSQEDTMQLGDNDSLAVLRSNVQLTVTSDERDKADIQEVSSALDFVKKLRPVTFVKNPRGKYISEEDKKGSTFRKYGMCDYDKVAHSQGTLKGNRRRIGLLAQETQIALQEVYGTDNYADIVNDNFYDLVDKPIDVENKLTIAYSNLVPFLIGAIKEQQKQIEMLKESIDKTNATAIE